MLAGQLGRLTSHDRPINHGRIVDASVVNSTKLVYALDRRPMLAVLDGDVVLEPTCYEVDRKAGTIQLKGPPAFGLRMLVQ